MAISGAWRNGPTGLGLRPLRGSTTQLMSARTQAVLGWKEAGHWDKPLLSGKSVCSDSDSRDRRHKEGASPLSFFQPLKSHSLHCTGRP